MVYTPEQIAGAINAPLTNVQESWPGLLTALTAEGINTRAVRVACAATVSVETGVTEAGQNVTFLAKTVELNGPNTSYAPYYGRGYIQLTWRANYQTYGDLLGVDLVDNPDLACEPAHAARILALYFVRNNVAALAEAGNWIGVRVAVNGGTFGLALFEQYVANLLAIPEPPDPLPDPYTVRGHVWHVITRSGLKQAPNHESALAIGPDKKGVMLAPGATVISTGAVTPHWVKVTLPAPSPVWGWLLQDALRA